VFIRFTTIANGTVLGLAGALHLLWSTGLTTWPEPDGPALARVYAARQQLPPGPVITAVGIVIIGAAVILLAKIGVFGRYQAWVPGRLITVGAWVVAVGLLVRGLLFLGNHVFGFPSGTAPEFLKPDLYLYSPLCVVLGVAAVLTARYGVAAPLRRPVPSGQAAQVVGVPQR
jgi:hypothetical protein